MNMLYPDASEALHGTMRGITFHYAHDPHYGPNTEESMKEDYFLMNLLICIFLSADVTSMI